MKIENIDIQATIEKAQAVIREDKQMSAGARSIIEILILVITLLVNRLNLNSTNSSKPPSSDPNREKQPKSKNSKTKGGQKGHVGATLQKVDDPDVIELIKIDRRTLPAGRFHDAGYEARQVFDIDISRVVTEYRAQVLEDENGSRYVAPFPEGVTKAVQYGVGIKSHAVYLSQFQLIPYNRIQDYFADQLHIPVSDGSIFNFNKQAFEALDAFEDHARERLKTSAVAHADETGINMGGDFGFIVYPALTGRFIMPIKEGVWKRLRLWGYCPGSKASCATITGRPIIGSIAPMLCVMHTI